MDFVVLIINIFFFHFFSSYLLIHSCLFVEQQQKVIYKVNFCLRAYGAQSKVYKFLFETKRNEMKQKRKLLITLETFFNF